MPPSPPDQITVKESNAIILISAGTYPVGELYAGIGGGALTGLYYSSTLFDKTKSRLQNYIIKSEPDSPEGREVLEALKSWMKSYFDGEYAAPTFPLKPGGTPFRLRVYDELKKLKHGEVVSYGQIAARLGMASTIAARAVGQAVGANPIPIILPCHRVVGAGGRLTGYSDGLDIKRQLLIHEGFTVRGDRLILPD